MKRILLVLMMIGCFLGYGASGAFAVPLNSYTLNFSAAGDVLGANLSDIDNVDEWQFLAHSVIAFQDIDNSGGLSMGDTFDDFVALRVTGITDSSSNALQSTTYGTGAGRDHEMTVLAKFSGVQTTANSYSLNSLGADEFFNIYFDAEGDLNSFTGSNFDDLDTFADGILVETAGLNLGGGVNTDPTGITGTLSMVLTMFDNLNTFPAANGEFFEVDGDGNPFPLNMVLGIVDTGNNPQSINVSELENYFNVDFSSDDYDFYFTARNDGSFNKAIVPEPATLMLFGVGLLGLAGIGRRRRAL